MPHNQWENQEFSAQKCTHLQEVRLGVSISVHNNECEAYGLMIQSETMKLSMNKRIITLNCNCKSKENHKVSALIAVMQVKLANFLILPL